MSLNIYKKRDTLTVESDKRGNDVIHGHIHRDRQLRGAMTSYGIKSVEVKKDDPDMYDVKKSFDEEYKKKEGRKSGYFY